MSAVWHSAAADSSSHETGGGDGASPLRQGTHANGTRAKKQFRRVNGHLHLPALQTALNEHIAAGVTPPTYTAEQEVAA